MLVATTEVPTVMMEVSVDDGSAGGDGDDVSPAGRLKCRWRYTASGSGDDGEVPDVDD